MRKGMQLYFAGHSPAWERTRYKITFVYLLSESVPAVDYVELPLHDQGLSQSTFE